MEKARFSADCVESSFVLAARCRCCDGVKLLMLDETESILAIGTVSVSDLRCVLSLADAGALPAIDLVHIAQRKATH